MNHPLNLWAPYVRALIGDMTQTEVSEIHGLDASQTTIGRWKNGEKVPTSPARVASVAIAFGHGPLEAFVAAGMITTEQAGAALTQDEREFLANLKPIKRAKGTPIRPRRQAPKPDKRRRADPQD